MEITFEKEENGNHSDEDLTIQIVLFTFKGVKYLKKNLLIKNRILF